MNLLRNSVQLIGHLGKDPEMTKLDNGKRIARVSLVTNENYGEKGKDTQPPQWHNLVAWDGNAEFISNTLGKDKRSQYKADYRIAAMKPRMVR